MFRSPRLIILLIVVAAGYYVYRTNWLVKLDANLGLSTTDVSVQALGGTYHDCKITLTGEYEASLPTAYANQTHYIHLTQFHQWNGTLLESTKMLQDEVEISLRCKEGRFSEKVDNPEPLSP